MATFTSGSRRGWGCDSSALLDHHERIAEAYMQATTRIRAKNSPRSIKFSDSINQSLFVGMTVSIYGVSI
jgi:hypothetical protein